MLTLICNRGRYSVKLDDITLSAEEFGLVGYALGSYGFVNSKTAGNYQVTAKEWASNIREVYGMGEPRTAKIVTLLEKIR